MATFYGQVAGNRGSASRTGSRDSGIKASVQSYHGSIITRLWYNREDELMCEVEYSDGSAFSWGTHPLFYGSFKEFVEVFKGEEW